MLRLHPALQALGYGGDMNQELKVGPAAARSWVLSRTILTQNVWLLQMGRGGRGLALLEAVRLVLERGTEEEGDAAEGQA